ncbi:MAG: alpha/beta hydrolase [Pseudonocardiales bacterium]|nr:alpha/beta hydrolase [Pseudonocardiales bacterium]
MVNDYTVRLGGMTLGVRESGPSDGLPVLHFHGTPGSRLELAWADEAVAQAGVHLVAFDRPGYGRSTQMAFSLAQVARLGIDLADRLGWQRFTTLGWSGGGPFALATAAEAAGRVSAVGVISGAGPFQEMPAALEGLGGGDAYAAALLMSNRDAAAVAFADTFTDLAAITDDEELLTAFRPALSARDQDVLAQPTHAAAFLLDMQEAFRQGSLGGGWDNVAWVGPWDFALDAVKCPVLLWYGDEDLMAPLAVGRWLADHLPNARLTMRQGYGHLAAFEHLPEMLNQLTRGASTD